MTLQTALFAAAAAVAESACALLGTREAALAEFPFLDEFLAPAPDADVAHPPLDRLVRAAHLDDEARAILLTIALVDEDARFGVLFEALQTSPGQHRPTLGLLARLRPGARAAARALVVRGLVRVLNPEAPRAEAVLEVPAALWEALADGLPPAWARLRARAELRPRTGLHLPAALHAALTHLPAEPTTVVVRGPRHNGRATLLGAVAHDRGWNLLEVDLPAADPRLPLAGAIASALDALLVLRLDPGPGQTVDLPWPPAYDRHLGVVMPRHGGLDGEATRDTVVLRRDMPDLELRAAQWTDAAPGCDVPRLAAFRLTSGGLARAARLAAAAAARRGDPLTPTDVRDAARTLHREAFDQLAAPLEPSPRDHLVVAGVVERELLHLERRCARREDLPAAVGPALRRLSPGVRALFTGPSGTGKTLAARALAGALGMDLYRLDLGAVTSKYIGETEKNLERVLASAEELDIILLLDEGDALMTRRTAVASANDRYANLETNFLLQRLEDFTGIVVVTTNAAERIDPAFARRMDVVVDFHLPEADERARLWTIHLPDHALVGPALAELAELCRLSGAQIRNAAIHAALLGLEAARPPGLAELRAAVDREYRKMGASSPLGTP